MKITTAMAGAARPESVDGFPPLSREEAKFASLEDGLRKRAIHWYARSRKLWSFLDKDAHRFLGILGRWLIAGGTEERLVALERLLEDMQALLKHRHPDKKAELAKSGVAFIMRHPDITDPERDAALKLLANLGA